MAGMDGRTAKKDIEDTKMKHGENGLFGMMLVVVVVVVVVWIVGSSLHCFVAVPRSCGKQ